MATWFRDALFVLRKSLHSTLFIGLLASVALAALGVQVVFLRLESSQAKTIATVLGSLLRDESVLSRSYLLAQAIEDMQTLGAIRCARLSKTEGVRSSVFYDSTFKAKCSSLGLTRVELPGLDGDVWRFEIVPNQDLSFHIIKWLTLASTMLLLCAMYRMSRGMLASQERAIEAIEAKRFFLEQLTDQVRHDVASPISALKVIADRAPLEPDMKEFLQQAVSRTSAIFQGLQRPGSRPQTFLLGIELKKLVDEKVLSKSDFPRVRIESHDFLFHLDRREFGRMISNLLENACEAGASVIEIRVKRSPAAVQLVIADDGRPIPGSVKANLGVRGNTSDKTAGSGLGLYHAFQFMRSIGGALEIVEAGKDKFQLTFPERDVLRSG